MQICTAAKISHSTKGAQKEGLDEGTGARRGVELHCDAQDSGTAIFLFAYFGYWLEVIIVLTARAAKGTLLSAVKRRPAGQPALPTAKDTGSPGTSPSPDAKNPRTTPLSPSLPSIFARTYSGFDYSLLCSHIAKGMSQLYASKEIECSAMAGFASGGC